MKVSAAQLPPDGGDDRIFITTTGVIMLDGASAYIPVPVPASTHADQLGRYLAEHLDDAADLRSTLADAITDTAQKLGIHPGASPCSTVTILRQTGSHLECLVLGDNLIALPDKAITDDRLARFGRQQRKRYHAHMQGGHGYNGELGAILAELQTEEARHRNQPGGYWIAEADPQAANHARLSRHPIGSVPWAVLATDGAYKPMTHLGLADWAALRDASDRDLAQLLERCQSWESENDPAGIELPRAKRHDDKSLAVVTFTG